METLLALAKSGGFESGYGSRGGAEFGSPPCDVKPGENGHVRQNRLVVM